MFAKFYGKPDGTKTRQQLFVFAAKAISLDYQKNFCKTGEFILTMPFDSDSLHKICLNMIIEFNSFFFFVESISYDYKQIVISGHDLKQVLYLRISTYGATTVAGTEGYDVVSGTTAQCIEHYLNNNIISSADTSRRMPMIFNANSVTGLSDDSYMARLENVGGIVEKLCNNAGIGYDATLVDNGGTAKIQIKLLAVRDNTSVIFSPEWGTVSSVSFEHEDENLYTTIYATGANVTQTVNRINNVSGLSRRECAVDVSVDSVDEIEKYALYATEENVETNTAKIGALYSDFGTRFDVGDLVTVREPVLNNTYQKIITGAHISLSAGSQTAEITLGKPKQKLLNKIVNNMLNGTIRRG